MCVEKCITIRKFSIIIDKITILSTLYSSKVLQASFFLYFSPGIQFTAFYFQTHPFI